MPRFLLGLTGGLASGKSTVARRLGEAGFLVVDADRVVAELYEPGGRGAAAVRELFGDDVLTAEGAVDRPKVAQHVFHDAEARRALERAIHPLVGEHLRKIVERAEGVVVYEATLMVESGNADACDLVLSVEAPEDKRLAWAIARGMSEQQARARLAAQGDGAARRAGADRLLDNSGTLDELHAKIDALIEELRAKVV